MLAITCATVVWCMVMAVRLGVLAGDCLLEGAGCSLPAHLLLGLLHTSHQPLCPPLPIPPSPGLQVTVSIEEKERGNTVVQLTQSGIPETDRFGNHDVVGTTEAGWKDQVFRRIRGVFGYGL